MDGPPDMGGATFEDGSALDELAAKIAERIQPPDERPLLTPRTLAVRLAVSERTARQMLIDGVIPSFVVGESARRIDPRKVDEYLRGQADA